MNGIYRINLSTLSPKARKRSRRTTIPLRGFLTDWLIISTLALATAVSGFIFTRERQSGARHDGLLRSVAEALRDSTRLDEDIRLAESYRIRRAQINDHIELVRSVDRGRYVWAHVLDEMAIAVPPDLWLSEWSQNEILPDGHNVIFQIHGNASNASTLNDFIRALEASPFLTDISLRSSEQRDVAGQRVLGFQLLASTTDADPMLLDLQEVLPRGEASAATPEPARPLPSSLPLLRADGVPSPTSP